MQREIANLLATMGPGAPAVALCAIVFAFAVCALVAAVKLDRGLL